MILLCCTAYSLLCIPDLNFALDLINGAFVSPGAASDVVESLGVHKQKPTKGSPPVVRDKVSSHYERGDEMFRLTYQRRRSRKPKSASVQPMVG